MSNFQDAATIKNETGIVFGAQGSEFLEVAIERAAGLGEPKRPVRVLCATNLAAVSGKAVQAVRIKSRDGLKEQIAALKEDHSNHGYVFHGLNEYAQFILNAICKEATPVQADWGDAARQISNDLVELADVVGILYVTADVVEEEKGPKDNKVLVKRLSINPGLEKLIFGNLVQKIYVYSRRGARGIQESPALAVEFRTADAVPVAASTEAPAKTVRKLDK